MMGYITIFIIGCAVGYCLKTMSMRDLADKNADTRGVIKNDIPVMRSDEQEKFYLTNLEALFSEYEASGLRMLVNAIRKKTKINLLRQFCNMKSSEEVIHFYNNHKIAPIQVENKVQTGSYILSSTLSERMEDINMPEGLLKLDVEKKMNAYLNFFYAEAVEDVIKMIKVPLDILERESRDKSKADKEVLDKFKQNIKSFIDMIE